jgi:hypothetical protein
MKELTSHSITGDSYVLKRVANNMITILREQIAPFEEGFTPEELRGHTAPSFVQRDLPAYQ